MAKRIQKNINPVSLEGQPAPALDLSEHLGPPPPPLASLKGMVVLLFFWAHWCSDCKNQGPALAVLADKYLGRGLVVFAPTQRFGYVAGGKDAPATEERRYIEQVRQEFYSRAGSTSRCRSPRPTHLRYGVSTTPTLVLVLGLPFLMPCTIFCRAPWPVFAIRSENLRSNPSRSSRPDPVTKFTKFTP